jgi:hypothetical protein
LELSARFALIERFVLSCYTFLYISHFCDMVAGDLIGRVREPRLSTVGTKFYKLQNHGDERDSDNDGRSPPVDNARVTWAQ